MFPLALTLVLAAPPVKPAAPAEDSPRVSAPAASPQVLESPAQVRAMCEALTPSERVLAKGDVVERARFEAVHDSRREVALDARYRVQIAADRLRFAEYDPDEKLLVLSDRAFLAAASGS